MSLDKATVAHIAALARIRLPDEELDRMAGELVTGVQECHRRDERDDEAAESQVQRLGDLPRGARLRIRAPGVPGEVRQDADAIIRAFAETEQEGLRVGVGT